MVDGQPTRGGRHPRLPRLVVAGLLTAILAPLLAACGPVVAPPTYGAKTIGTTNYPVPAGAKFVSLSGRDSNPGTSAAPFRTLTRAVAAAPSGGTVVLRRGTYREDVEVPATKVLTIQPAPGEAVWLSGSQVVTGWVRDGTAWRKDGWRTRFDRSGLNPTLIDPRYPTAGWPDMAFVNGTPLRQVASRAAVGSGRFFVDYTNSRLYIGSNPSFKTVEASVLSEALNVKSSGSVVRGIGFRHYANHIARLGAVKGSGNSITFEHNVFSYNAAAGLSLRGDSIRVRSNTADHNGQIGIHAETAGRLLLESNRLATNNIEHFYPAAAAGGAKATGSDDVIIRRNLSEGNFGHGLWLDESSDRAVFVRNLTRRNQDAGILFEYSNGVVIAGNVSHDNEAGLLVNEASSIDIWNNTVHNNARSIAGYDGRRTPLPTGITVRNNVISAGSRSTRPMALLDDANKLRSWLNMRFTADYNAYYRRSTGSTPYVAALANYPVGKLLYKSLGALRSGVRQEVHAMIVENTAANPFVANAGAGTFTLPATSPARGKGLALPTRVASALGVRAGVAVNIGATI